MYRQIYRQVHIYRAQSIQHVASCPGFVILLIMQFFIRWTRCAESHISCVQSLDNNSLMSPEFLQGRDKSLLFQKQVLRFISSSSLVLQMLYVLKDQISIFYTITARTLTVLLFSPNTLSFRLQSKNLKMKIYIKQ